MQVSKRVQAVNTRMQQAYAKASKARKGMSSSQKQVQDLIESLNTLELMLSTELLNLDRFTDDIDRVDESVKLHFYHNISSYIETLDSLISELELDVQSVADPFSKINSIREHLKGTIASPEECSELAEKIQGFSEEISQKNDAHYQNSTRGRHSADELVVNR